MKPLTRRLLLIAVSCIAAAAIGAFIWSQSIYGQLAALYGGRSGLKTVTSPDKVEAYRLASSDYGLKPPDGYPVAAGPITVPSNLSAKLSQVLASADSYRWNSAKACEPKPGVRLSFHRGDNRIDVLLCFECEELFVYRNGSRTGYEDFDNIAPTLIAVAKSLFPNDHEIQSLGTPN